MTSPDPRSISETLRRVLRDEYDDRDVLRQDRETLKVLAERLALEGPPRLGDVMMTAYDRRLWVVTSKSRHPKMWYLTEIGSEDTAKTTQGFHEDDLRWRCTRLARSHVVFG